MADKFDMLERDIVSLLQKHEPYMLRWNEIVEILWQTYQSRYKDRKGLGVAVTGKLRLLVEGGKICHKELFYGTPNSLMPDALSSIENAKKAQAEVEAVRLALEELQRELRFFREPTLIEVSCKAGKPPATVEPILYVLANEMGWTPQENPEKEAEQAINLAGWLCWKQRNEQNLQLQALTDGAIGSASKETLRRAQRILENYPDLVPSVSLREIVWSQKTKSMWNDVFGSEAPSRFWEIDEGFVSVKELFKRPAYRQFYRGLEFMLP
jgi:hypothetical protein